MAVEYIDLSEYNGDDLVITAALFLTLSWLSVGLRTYTRAYLMNCFQADDWLMLIAQVCSSIYGSILATTNIAQGDIHSLMRLHSRGSPSGDRST